MIREQIRKVNGLMVTLKVKGVRFMYKAILFSPDGMWVTDCHGKTIEEVWDKVSNLGSRWYFYPFPAIIRDYGYGTVMSRQRIVEVYTEYDSSYAWMKGKSIKTVSNYLEKHPMVGF
jgi:hypothetical protein